MTSQIKRILVVEDNELNMKLFRDILVFHGYEVLISDNSRVGYTICKREKPDLIVTDIKLRNGSGYDLVTAIRQDKEVKLTPIIAVTASTAKSVVNVIKSHGFNEYMSKPIDIKHFLAQVKIHIEKKKVLV